MENNWNLTGGSTIGLLTVFFAAIAAFFIIRNIKKDRNGKRAIVQEENAKKNVKVGEREKSQDEQTKKLELAEHCCDIMEEIAKHLAEGSYEKLFLRYAPFYQRVIGLKRQAERENMTAALFTGTILLEAESTSIDRVLDENGFRVNEKQQCFERENIKDKCLTLKISALEYQIRQEESYLRQLRQKLPYRKMIHGTEHLVVDMIESAKREDMATCIQDIKRVEDCLVQCGCYILFADAPQVKESEELRVDFSEDAPMEVELPGFYTFSESLKKYYLLGTCAGTRRRSL